MIMDWRSIFMFLVSGSVLGSLPLTTTLMRRRWPIFV
jgi:hypothetical protein